MFQLVFSILKDNCIGGCPCDKYSCAETTLAPDTTTTMTTTTKTTIPPKPPANAVLVLSDSINEYNRKPLVIDFDGRKKF